MCGPDSTPPLQPADRPAPTPSVAQRVPDALGKLETPCLRASVLILSRALRPLRAYERESAASGEMRAARRAGM